MKWSCIQSYSLPIEAQIAKSRLISVGIPVRIDDEHTINMDWLYSNAIGGVRLWVPVEHVKDAMYLISTDFSQDLNDQFKLSKDCCPKCGHDQFDTYTQGKRCAYLIFTLINFPLAPFKHGKRCRNCHYFKCDI